MFFIVRSEQPARTSEPRSTLRRTNRGHAIPISSININVRSLHRLMFRTSIFHKSGSSRLNAARVLKSGLGLDEITASHLSGPHLFDILSPPWSSIFEWAAARLDKLFDENDDFFASSEAGAVDGGVTAK